MKIIEPSVELIKQVDPIVHIANCASICYGKEEAKYPERLYKSLQNKGHLSVFRHESVYAIIPSGRLAFMDTAYKHCPYIDIRFSGNNCYIATNKNFIFDHVNEPFIHLILDNQVEPDYFANTELGYAMMRYTFKITTQISTSRELNRVSPNSITERSTRYVYEDGTICRPHWIKEEINREPYKSLKAGYIDICNNAFETYKHLVDYGMNRQDARGVLPLDTATKVVYTYSVDEWRHIIDLRYYGTTGKPHPNAKIIASKIRQSLIDLGYSFRADEQTY